MTVQESAVGHSFPQTNLQLFNQMLDIGYTADDLALIHRCHGLVIQLFSGKYRANGKPFLAHLIGTAGILASLQAPVSVVGAGLLHAAYEHGDFGMLFPKSRRRDKLRRESSRDVEELVYRYSRLTWSAAVLPTLRREMPVMEPQQKNVALIGLANELEDSIDSGLLFSRELHEGQILAGSHADGLVELARDLGQPNLADLLARAAREYHVVPPPPEVLRSPTSAPFTVVSPSYGLRASVRVGRFLFRISRPVLDRMYTFAFRVLRRDP